MRAFLLAVVVLSAPCGCLGKRVVPSATVPGKGWRGPAAVEAKVEKSKSRTRFQRFAEKLFDDADDDGSGSISFGEAYALVLKLYVQLNRQAPIPPPSIEMVRRLYLDADASNNKRLDRDEFKHLVAVVGSRALWKVTAVKLCRIVGAPLLAEAVIRLLAGREWPRRLADAAVPGRFRDRLLPALMSAEFWRPVLLIAFVICLGNAVLGILNVFLDMSLPPDEESREGNDPRL